jgi:cell wall-associated NlpC family hydrolase
MKELDAGLDGVTRVLTRISEIEAKIATLTGGGTLTTGTGSTSFDATLQGTGLYQSSAVQSAVSSGKGQQVVAAAEKYLGVPYVWGGEGPSGFDCSGLVTYVYKQFGVDLPHYTVSQAAKGTPVDRANLQPGDVIFFGENGGTGFLYHTGIYVGNNQFIQAPHTGDVVKISKLEGKYDTNYACARRYL